MLPCMQGAAEVACRELGFATGSFQLAVGAEAEVSPPWLASVRCNGSEATIADCELSAFGDTWTCGLPLRLYCATAGADPSCVSSAICLLHLIRLPAMSTLLLGTLTMVN